MNVTTPGLGDVEAGHRDAEARHVAVLGIAERDRELGELPEDRDLATRDVGRDLVLPERPPLAVGAAPRAPT